MPNTTTAAVQGTLGRDYDSRNAPDLTTVVSDASLFMTRVEECAAAKGVTLSAGELEAIERYYAAYLYTGSDRLYTSKSTLSASGSFLGEKGGENPYLTRAMQLDPSGCVKALTATNGKAKMTWLGKTVDEQTPYEDW